MKNSGSVTVVGGGIVGSFVALNLSKDYEVHWVTGGSTRNAAAWGSAGLVQPGSGSLFQKYPGIFGLLKWIFSEGSIYRVSPGLLASRRRWFSLYSKQPTNTDEATILWRRMASEGLREIEPFVKEIGCDNSKGLLQFYRSSEALEGKRGSMQKDSVAFKDIGPAECRDLEPELPKNVVGGFLFADDLWINPAELLEKLREKLRESTTLHEEKAKALVANSGKISGVILESRPLKSDDYVVAAGASLPSLLETVGLRVPIIPAWGHMISLRPPRRLLSRVVQMGESRAVIAQTRDLSVRAVGFVEMVSPAHRFPPRKYLALKKMVSGAIPSLGSSEVTDTWSGMRPVTPDGLPIVGRTTRYENLLIAAGHGRLGVTLAPATGRMVKELLMHREVGGARFLGPKRFGL